MYDGNDNEALVPGINNKHKKINDTTEPIIPNVLYIGAYVLLCLL